MSEEEPVRCWICLDDETDVDDAKMIAPCACVGTNQWVHEACLKTYCLQHLAAHAASSPALRVACPICRVDYEITARGASASSPATWAEVMRWSTTDQQLLLRHARFFFLVAPLVSALLIAWTWLIYYWLDLYTFGAGEPLLDNSGDMANNRPLSPVGDLAVELPTRLVAWMRMVAAEILTSGNATDDDLAQSPLSADAASAGPPATPSAPHPAGISKNWSVLYVWLQYAQWCKVLCWLLALVLGGTEGLLPSGIREALRVEELLLASDTRAQAFIFGQFLPFVLAKVRHLLVSWAGGSYLVRLLCYSVFTSHVEVGIALACDAATTTHLMCDWVASAQNDFRLRLNLNRLRSGHFAIASRHAAPPLRRSASDSKAHPHAD